MADKECRASEFDILPEPVLQQIVQDLRWSRQTRGALLQTNCLLRDTVLFTSKRIRLAVDGKAKPADIAVHQPLLRRACAAARPGLQLDLTAECKFFHDRDNWGKQSLLEHLLEPFKEQGLPNVHGLTLDGWHSPQGLGHKSFIVTSAFPNLTDLHLSSCTITSPSFFASLLLCPQLRRLTLMHCGMTVAAIAALPVLQRLQGLQDLHWVEANEDHATDAQLKETLASLAGVSQLTSLHLGSNRLGAEELTPTATRMSHLQTFIAGIQYMTDHLPPPSVIWEVLPSASLSQLLSSCSVLRTLCLEGTVLDQAGLDLLLAHPHINDVTLLALAATEPRVHSPCSWEELHLPTRVDIRTVAYVPLHSLKKPLLVAALLLPPDVPQGQLPELLQAATTRMAQHRHLFRFLVTHDIGLADHIDNLDTMELPWGEPVPEPYSPETRLALLAALAPLAAVSDIQGLCFDFLYDSDTSNTEPPSMQFGEPELQLLQGAWGSRLTRLTLSGVQIVEGFFPGLPEACPQLDCLALRNLDQNDHNLRTRLMLLCHRITRPLHIALDTHMDAM